jgi:hypothetical protein
MGCPMPFLPRTDYSHDARGLEWTEKNVRQTSSTRDICHGGESRASTKRQAHALSTG